MSDISRDVSTIRYGDEDVPVLARPWREAPDVVGCREVFRLRPGQSFVEAPVNDRMYEALVLVDGEPLPVGVVIAAELMREGVDWAYCTEVFGGRLVVLDHAAMCVTPNEHATAVFQRLLDANSGRLAGLPDVVAARGDVVILREAKRVRKDKLQPQQHAFAVAAQRLLGPKLDLAVVEWADEERLSTGRPVA